MLERNRPSEDNKIAFVRTPDDSFADLPDYPFTPNFVDVGGLRMHYVEQGQENDKTIFLLHGQPSWSYLYRKMIPLFADAGYRVIAPDLIGFGKSDKPIDRNAHTYQAHVTWIRSLVQQLGIKNAAAFMQDWGGMIGLRVLAQEPDWLSRLVVANTALSDSRGLEKFILPRMLKLLRALAGKASIDDLAAKQSYGNWASYFHHAPMLDIGRIMQILTTRNLDDAEMAAYNAPFPNPRFYAGPRTMPQIVGTQLDEGRAAWSRLRRRDIPVLTLFSDKDPFLAGRGIDKQFQSLPGAKGQPHQTISDASHFLQEDKGPELAEKVMGWLADTDYR